MAELGRAPMASSITLHRATRSRQCGLKALFGFPESSSSILSPRGDKMLSSTARRPPAFSTSTSVAARGRTGALVVRAEKVLIANTKGGGHGEFESFHTRSSPCTAWTRHTYPHVHEPQAHQMLRFAAHSGGVKGFYICFKRIHRYWGKFVANFSSLHAAFIGLHLAKKLLQDGHSVTILNDGEKVSSILKPSGRRICGHRCNVLRPPGMLP